MTDSRVVHTNSLRTYVCTLKTASPNTNVHSQKSHARHAMNVHSCVQVTGTQDTARRQSPAFPLRLLSFLQLLDAAEDAMSVTEGRDAEVIPQLLVAEGQ